MKKTRSKRSRDTVPLRIKSVLSVYALIVLKNFAALLWRTDKVLACFYESNDSIFKTLKKLIS
jgi:hypothetical protein